ncbi:MAG: flagellar hook-length control protein FliK [Lachnospiraceae bacterium]|nr:flagellar hook-length control protein FliK [Lachnospiraceae bacterium]
MTSVGINAASLATQTASFVSVSMSQVTVAKGQDFSSMLRRGIEAQAVTQSGGNRTYTDLKVSKTEISKEATPVSAQNKAAGTVHDKAVNENAAVNNTATDKPATVETSKTDNAENPDAAVDEELDGKDIQNLGNLLKANGIKADDDCVKALEILNTLMQGIAQILDTTLQNLQGCYEELNIEPSEMFTVTSIQLTVVTFEGLNDTSDLLVNNDAFDLFNKINEFVQSVFDEAGIDMSDFQDILKSDMFAEFIGPGETGNAEEILQKFTFDENGKLVIPEKAEDDPKPVIQENVSDDEPFTVEVNIDRNVNIDENNEQGAGTGSKESFESAKTSSTVKSAKDTRTTATPAQTFVQGLERALQVTDIDMPVAEGVTVRDIVYQVVDAIRVNITNESTSLEMNLNPENLGKVSLNIQSKDGVMTAQITAENDVARAAIESQLQILKDNIEAQGVRVEAIEVTVSSFSFSDSKNAESEAREHPEDNSRVGRTGRASTASDSGEVEDLSVEERLEQEVMEQNGSTVSYRA